MAESITAAVLAGDTWGKLGHIKDKLAGLCADMEEAGSFTNERVNAQGLACAAAHVLERVPMDMDAQAVLSRLPPKHNLSYHSVVDKALDQVRQVWGGGCCCCACLHYLCYHCVPCCHSLPCKLNVFNPCCAIASAVALQAFTAEVWHEHMTVANGTSRQTLNAVKKLDTLNVLKNVTKCG